MTQQNNEKREVIFTEGLRVTVPSATAPEYIVANLAFFVPDFIGFLENHRNNGGWVNVDIKKSQKGGMYGQLNTYVPKPKVEEKKAEPLLDPATGHEVGGEDSPF